MDVTDKSDKTAVPARKPGQSLADYVRDTLGVPEASAQEYEARDGQTTVHVRVSKPPTD